MVNKNWLLECYRRQKRVSLRSYLVGDSILSVDHQIDEDEDDEILSSQPAASMVPAELNKGTDLSI